MRYQQSTFTVPVASPRVTQEQYEVAVGLRCPKCRHLCTSDDTHTCYIPPNGATPLVKESK